MQYSQYFTIFKIFLSYLEKYHQKTWRYKLHVCLFLQDVRIQNASSIEIWYN